jgi:hypothetical protein
MTKNTKIHSTLPDERKHSYLIENKEKRTRSLDTLVNTVSIENRPNLALRFSPLRPATPRTFWGS